MLYTSLFCVPSVLPLLHTLVLRRHKDRNRFEEALPSAAQVLGAYVRVHRAHPCRNRCRSLRG